MAKKMNQFQAREMYLNACVVEAVAEKEAERADAKLTKAVTARSKAYAAWAKFLGA